LDIADDILFAVKEILRQRGVALGKALSELARQALTRQAAVSTRRGLALFPIQPEAGVVTMELVNRLRDETS
jgi:hypothetical protein